MDDGFDINSPRIMLPITMGDFEKAIKQARSEVLAACANKARAWYTGHPEGMHGEDDYCFPCSDGDRLAKSILELQPAAKALEVLLWPGRELSKAVLEWETAMGVNEVSHENSRRIYDASAKMLEKARAIEEKP